MRGRLGLLDRYLDRIWDGEGLVRDGGVRKGQMKGVPLVCSEMSRQIFMSAAKPIMLTRILGGAHVGLVQGSMR